MELIPVGHAVGRAVRQLREERGWTQDTAASRLRSVGLGWSRSRLVDLETERRKDITLGELALIAECFGVAPRDLLPPGGSVRVGNTFRPVRVLRAMLTGGRAPNSDLLGPVERPALESQLTGRPPFWTRPSEKATLLFPQDEVDLARLAGEDVDLVHRFVMQRQLGALSADQSDLHELLSDFVEWRREQGNAS